MKGKKRGKKKGDILARMTVDQRRQYLERKAAQEQDRARRREELLAGFLKLKLDDEQRKAFFNENKLNVKWREVLREVKSKALFTQLNNIKHTTEESVRDLDSLIHFLRSSLADAREQRTMLSQNHLSFVKSFSGVHESHIGLLTKDFRSKELQVLSNAAEDIQDAAMSHIHQISRLKLVEEAAEKISTEVDNEDQTAFYNSIAAIRTKLEEEAAEAAAEEEEQLEEAWFHLATYILKYEEQTSNVSHECEDLHKKVSNNRHVLRRINQEIRQLLEEISAWKVRLAETASVEDLDEDKLQKNLKIFQKSLARQRKDFRQVVKQADKRSRDTKEKLSETIKLGEEIVHIANLCRKLETDEDRNIPFYPKIESFYGQQDLEISAMSSLSKMELTTLSVEQKVRAPSEQDSGLGTSKLTTSEGSICYHGDNDDGKANLSNVGEEDPISEEKGEQEEMTLVMRDHISDETLSRVRKLLSDEKTYLQIVGRRKKHTPPSEFVLKEAELALQTHDSLSHFWRKRSNVLFQLKSVRQRSRLVKYENEHLQKILKEHFMANGISKESLKKTDSSPLIVGRAPNNDVEVSSIRSEDRQKSYQKPILEGNIVIRNIQQHSK